MRSTKHQQLQLLHLYFLKDFFLLSRSCDGALPPKAPDRGAKSLTSTVAPPEHLGPQRHHQQQGKQFKRCYRQPVPSHVCADGSEPERMCCLSARYCPQRSERDPENIPLSENPFIYNDLPWRRETLDISLVPALFCVSSTRNSLLCPRFTRMQRHCKISGTQPALFALCRSLS